MAPKKSRAQLEMESQQKAKAASKQAKAEARKGAGERKAAKAVKPRKDNVSQLTDDFSKSESSQSDESGAIGGGSSGVSATED